jgi:hypothetical protein
MFPCLYSLDYNVSVIVNYPLQIMILGCGVLIFMMINWYIMEIMGKNVMFVSKS